MKEHKVYEILNTLGIIEYIGYTGTTLENRLKNHLKSRFKERTDITINLVKSFNSKSEALLFEGKYKIENGFEWTERTKNGTIEGRSKGGKKAILTTRKLLTKESLSIGGINAIEKRKSNPEKWQESLKNWQIAGGKATGTIVGNKIRTCVCGRTIKGPSYFSHIKKCADLNNE